MSGLRYSADKIRAVVMVVSALPDFKKKNGELSDEDLRTYSMDFKDYFPLLLDYAAVYSPTLDAEGIRRRFAALSQEMMEKPVPVTGEDLINMGIKPGPNYKKLLDVVKKLYLKDPTTPKERYLSAVKNSI